MDTQKVLEIVTMFLAGLLPSMPVMLGIWMRIIKSDKSSKLERKNYDVLITNLEALTNNLNRVIAKVDVLDQEVRKDQTVSYNEFSKEVKEAIASLPENIKLDASELSRMIEKLSEVTEHVAKIRQ